MSSISTQTVDNLKQTLQNACKDPEKGIPGATVVVVNRNGKELFAHASGKKGISSDEDMTLDSVFWIASCTKMITGIAAMQLVEQGKLELDNSEQVEKIAPELKHVKVLEKGGKLVEKKRGITLRMLLNHTAGFGYAFFHEGLRDSNKGIGYDEFSGKFYDINQPLVNQPGEGWQYGLNVDWAGIIIERVSGLTLNTYFHKHIFEPLGLKDISMLPTASMKQNLAHMNFRDPVDGKLKPADHIMRSGLMAENDTEFLNSGGAGCFANPRDYVQILATLLNDGTSPLTQTRILSPQSVALMFENQIPSFPNFARNPTPTAKPHLTNAISELYPTGDNKPQGWGLSFMLAGGPTGRSEGTAHWAGLANLFWWCDREKGVAGMVASQILPFADGEVMGLWGGVEMGVYGGLRKEGAEKAPL
ncbi:hypothetical protein ACMFMG_003013 [Clarireedia jacksonii]